MKCGGTFSKGHIAVCSANDTTCFSCKCKGHFTRLCRPRRKNVNIVNSQIVDITDFNPSDFPDVNTDHVEWSESGQYKRMVRIWTKPKRRLSCIKCNYDFWRRRKRVEEVIEYWPRKKNQVILNIQVDSTSPVSFLKKNVLHELKLRDRYLKIYSVDKATKVILCGFTDNAINISEKVILPIFSNGWSHNDCHFFLTEGHERKILGKDNLPKVGIEVSQKYFPHFQTHKQCKSINSISQSDKDRKL